MDVDFAWMWLQYRNNAVMQNNVTAIEITNLCLSIALIVFFEKSVNKHSIVIFAFYCQLQEKRGDKGREGKAKEVCSDAQGRKEKKGIKKVPMPGTFNRTHRGRFNVSLRNPPDLCRLQKSWYLILFWQPFIGTWLTGTSSKWWMECHWNPRIIWVGKYSCWWTAELWHLYPAALPKALLGQGGKNSVLCL